MLRLSTERKEIYGKSVSWLEFCSSEPRQLAVICTVWVS